MALNSIVAWLSSHMANWEKLAFIFIGSLVLAILLVNLMMGPDNPE